MSRRIPAVSRVLCRVADKADSCSVQSPAETILQCTVPVADSSGRSIIVGDECPKQTGREAVALLGLCSAQAVGSDVRVQMDMPMCMRHSPSPFRLCHCQSRCIDASLLDHD